MNLEGLPIEVIRSRRRTLCLEIRDGRPLVRAPLRVSEAEIRRFLEQKRSWLESHLARAKAREKIKRSVPVLTEAEQRILLRQAREVFPERTAHFAALLGVTYGRITLRMQHTRWGSCSAKGNLNFNCLLLLAPPQVLDSVVVHELCHRKHMDHSPAFYAEILRVFPDYRHWDHWLKENGPLLLARLPG